MLQAFDSLSHDGQQWVVALIAIACFVVMIAAAFWWDSSLTLDIFDREDDPEPPRDVADDEHRF